VVVAVAPKTQTLVKVLTLYLQLLHLKGVVLRQVAPEVQAAVAVVLVLLGKVFRVTVVAVAVLVLLQQVNPVQMVFSGLMVLTTLVVAVERFTHQMLSTPVD
jgi:hypothetical protein